MESPKQAKQEEPVSTLYQYVPTEPVVLSPYVEVVDVKQKKIDAQQKDIDELKALVQQLLAKSGK